MVFSTPMSERENQQLHRYSVSTVLVQSSGIPWLGIVDTSFVLIDTFIVYASLGRFDQRMATIYKTVERYVHIYDCILATPVFLLN